MTSLAHTKSPFVFFLTVPSAAFWKELTGSARRHRLHAILTVLLSFQIPSNSAGRQASLHQSVGVGGGNKKRQKIQFD